MKFFARALASEDFRVVRFEFPYMASKRTTGKQKPPDREPVLRETWMRVIEMVGRGGLVIGGKSMGGRIASLVADEAGVAGLICLGYPFHPAGKPDQLRVEHLRTIKTPTLIVQGERDLFGSRDEVGSYSLAPAVSVACTETATIVSSRAGRRAVRSSKTGTQPWARSWRSCNALRRRCAEVQPLTDFWPVCFTHRALQNGQSL